MTRCSSNVTVISVIAGAVYSVTTLTEQLCQCVQSACGCYIHH